MFIDETRDIINEFVDNSVTEDYLESLLLPTREKILESNRKCNAYLHDSTEQACQFYRRIKRNNKIASDEANVAENTDDTVTTNGNNGKDGGDVCSTTHVQNIFYTI